MFSSIRGRYLAAQGEEVDPKIIAQEVGRGIIKGVLKRHHVNEAQPCPVGAELARYFAKASPSEFEHNERKQEQFKAWHDWEVSRGLLTRWIYERSSELRRGPLPAAQFYAFKYGVVADVSLSKSRGHIASIEIELKATDRLLTEDGQNLYSVQRSQLREVYDEFKKAEKELFFPPDNLGT